MKKLSTYLFLIFFSFSASSFADDIQDFEIEGITIGDSLLDYMSEEEIKENVHYVYPDKKFTVLTYKESTETYNWGILVEYKSNDQTYKIYGVTGNINFDNNIEGCYEKYDEIEKEISSMFKKNKIKKFDILPFGSEDGSTYKQTQFYFDSGDAVSVDCYYFPNTPSQNHLKVTMTSQELQWYLETLGRGEM